MIKILNDFIFPVLQLHMQSTSVFGEGGELCSYFTLYRQKASLSMLHNWRGSLAK